MNGYTIKLYDAAIEFLEGMPAFDPASYNPALVQEYCVSRFGAGYDPSRIERLVPTECSEQIRHNYRIVCGLIYLISGKHPEEIFGEEVEGNGALSAYKTCSANYRAASSALAISPKLKTVNEKSMDIVEHGIRGALAKKLLDISYLKNANITEFLAESAVLKDKFFITKSYDKIKWMELFEKERADLLKRANPKVEQALVYRSWEMHAITMEGHNHSKCDDYSALRKIGKDAWFCCSADGVGSAPDSHIGSEMATKAFETRIREAYQRYGDSDRLMWYLQFTLAKDAAKLWLRWLRAATESKEFSLANYSTTLLFTFGCKRFVACGRVGDGQFIVEKREKMNGETYGYFSLNDGISGVLQTSTMSVAHLIRNPRAMQISFFHPDEIAGILMTSDGANGVSYKTIDGVRFPHFEGVANAVDSMTALRNDSFEECAMRLREMCATYSSSNKYCAGRGDDCTMVYIKNGRT